MKQLWFRNAAAGDRGGDGGSRGEEVEGRGDRFIIEDDVPLLRDRDDDDDGDHEVMVMMM